MENVPILLNYFYALLLLFLRKVEGHNAFSPEARVSLGCSTGDIGTLGLVHSLHAVCGVLHILLNILLCNFRGVRQACLQKAKAAFDWHYLRLTLFRTLQTAIEFQHRSVLAISSGLMMYSRCFGGICNHEQTNNISGNCFWWVVEILHSYIQRHSSQLMTICIKVRATFVSVRFLPDQSGEPEQTDIYLHDGLLFVPVVKVQELMPETSEWKIR